MAINSARTSHASHARRVTVSARSVMEPRLARAVILSSPSPVLSAPARAAERCLLEMQLVVLRAQGIEATAIATTTSPADDDSGALGQRLRLALASIPAPLAELGGTFPQDTVPMIVFRRPVLLDCDMADLVHEHVERGRTCTALRPSRARDGMPLGFILSPDRLSGLCADGVATMAPDGADAEVTVRMAWLTTGHASELRRARRVWRGCARLLARHGYVCRGEVAWHPSARIAPSAHVRGPALIGPEALVEEEAHAGPWLVAGAGARVGERTWVEHAALGAAAVVHEDGCVYAGIAEPGAIVSARVPLLKAHLLGGETLPRLFDRDEPLRQAQGAYALGKRAMDVALALLALVLVVPLLAVVSALSLCSAGWPIFFRQERIGLAGAHFTVFKLRTMRRNAHRLAWHRHINLSATPSFKLPNDPRVTLIGRLLRKTSIDEIPQLINVLNGSMSLVGPRPVVPREISRYALYADDLVAVMPGMTGLWQVSGRSDTTYARRIMLDVKYRETCSLWLDCQILLRTLPAVLLLRGAE